MFAELWQFYSKRMVSVKIRFEKIVKRQDTIPYPRLSSILPHSSITSSCCC